MFNHEISRKPKRYLILLCIFFMILFSLGCFLNDAYIFISEGYTEDRESVWYKMLGEDESVSEDDQDDSEANGVHGSAGDETTSAEGGGQDGSSEADYGPLKPVGFVNYGEFDAVVMPYSFIPLGKTEQAPPSGASTVSSANSGSGTWPNTSRFISVPMGAYSWCIDWEEGDLDEDGNIDYFHYIQDGPTILDENDSDELDFAEEVAISAPPSVAQVYAGKCSVQLDDSCVGQPQETRIYSSPGWVMGTDYQPKVTAPANYFDYPSPEGITLTNGGGSGFQQAIILAGGQYLEATTSNLYSAIGVQPHGESTIGWARVLFDGVEVWRGDTSSYWHDAEAYVHAVYIEVRCFPPGTHTMRIEALGIAGSGGGQFVPIAFFGFRP